MIDGIDLLTWYSDSVFKYISPHVISELQDSSSCELPGQSAFWPFWQYLIRYLKPVWHVWLHSLQLLQLFHVGAIMREKGREGGRESERKSSKPKYRNNKYIKLYINECFINQFLNLQSGQNSSLQFSYSWVGPWHVFPFRQLRTLLLLPPPHELVHPDHELQIPHTAATKRKWCSKLKLWTFFLSLIKVNMNGTCIC